MVEVDEKVPARRQADVRKRRIFDDVVDGEKHSLPDLPPHAIAASLADKVAVETSGRHVLRVADGIEAVARSGDGVLVYVCGEYLYLRRGGEICCVLREHHRHRVGLFAGSASRNPNSHLIVMRLALKQLRYDVALQRRERLWIAEEDGHADE